MMLSRLSRRAAWWLTPWALVLVGTPAHAQVAAPPNHATGRVAIYMNSVQIRPDVGAAITMGEVVTNINYSLPDSEGAGFEYGLDLRYAEQANSARPTRVSMYDGYVGRRFASGRVRVRAGQLWLNDLGGLGSLTGGVFEYKQALTTSRIGRLRLGGFAGMEPKAYELGDVAGVRKFGGYGILEGSGGRRHVAGYVRLTNGGLAERSVVTVTNFVPVRSRVFVYQAAEYDLAGPAGQGTGGLTYLMANAHVSPTDRLDVQGLYHRGRSVDTRAITDDILAGRPLRDGALDALLYASAGGRVSVRLTRSLRVNGGYTRDRNNRDSAATGRVSGGVSAGNLGGSGVDLTVTESRIRRPTGQYDSLYVSAGRQIGRLVYVSGDYSSSASVVRFTGSDGIVIESRPETTQFGFSGVVTAGRHMSFTITAQRTRDADVSDLQVLSGMTYRLR